VIHIVFGVVVDVVFGLDKVVFGAVVDVVFEVVLHDVVFGKCSGCWKM